MNRIGEKRPAAAGLGIRDWGLGTSDRGVRRAGFTLVELLVVIAIIGILALLITAAAVPAVRAARRVVIVGDLSQLTIALERYKQDHGEYPPDFAGFDKDDNDMKLAILDHLRMVFPHYQLTGGTDDQWSQFRRDVKQLSANDPSLDEDSDKGLDVNELNPATALVFWLGGVSSAYDSEKKLIWSTPLVRFSANPANPFATDGSRLEPYFAFDEGRLRKIQDENIYGFAYQPPYVHDPDGGDEAPPFVYFRANTSVVHPGEAYDPDTQQFTLSDSPTAGTCVPYIRNHDSDETDVDSLKISTWFNDKSCQIICCGLDGIYAGEEAHVLRWLREDNASDTAKLTPEEDDNLTNFSKGTLEDWDEGK